MSGEAPTWCTENPARAAAQSPFDRAGCEIRTRVPVDMPASPARQGPRRSSPPTSNVSRQPRRAPVKRPISPPVFGPGPPRACCATHAVPSPSRCRRAKCKPRERPTPKLGAGKEPKSPDARTPRVPCVCSSVRVAGVLGVGSLLPRGHLPARDPLRDARGIEGHRDDQCGGLGHTRARRAFDASLARSRRALVVIARRTRRPAPP